MHVVTSFNYVLHTCSYLMGLKCILYIVLLCCECRHSHNGWSQDVQIRGSLMYTVEPPNKGHVGDNTNSAVVSFVERLPSLRRFKMY